MDELKPCPFCGDAPEVRVDVKFGGVSIRCGNRECGVDVEVWGSDEQNAIDIWNTRESQPCYADEADHRRCKYSVNRGWVERTCKQKRLFNLVSRECDGEYYQWHDEEMPRYCPSCGAKVVYK